MVGLLVDVSVDERLSNAVLCLLCFDRRPEEPYFLCQAFNKRRNLTEIESCFDRVIELGWD